MATIILSQTLVLSGGTMEQCKRLRINTAVDKKGIAVSKAWRDAKEDLPIKDAKQTLLDQGYKETQDFVRVTILPKGRALRTRIVRMTKIEGAQDDTPKTNMDQVNEQVAQAEEGLLKS